MNLWRKLPGSLHLAFPDHLSMSYKLKNNLPNKKTEFFLGGRVCTYILYILVLLAMASQYSSILLIYTIEPLKIVVMRVVD